MDVKEQVLNNRKWRLKDKTFNATFTDDLKPHSIAHYILQFYNNEVILCNYKKKKYLFILVYKNSSSNVQCVICVSRSTNC